MNYYYCLCKNIKELWKYVKKIVPTTIKVGATATLPSGSQATVINSGTETAAILDFGIPKGDPGINGKSATVNVGTTTTLPAGSDATVVNVGTETDVVLNFGIPKGKDGDVSSNVESSSLNGVINQEADSPQELNGGDAVVFRQIGYNPTNLISLDLSRKYITFNKIGYYKIDYSIYCYAKSGNTEINFGLYCNNEDKMKLGSSSIIETKRQCISGTGILNVNDVTNKYSFVNNSKSKLFLQGTPLTSLNKSLEIETNNAINVTIIKIG